MTYLDASALLALLLDEPAAAEVEDLLRADGGLMTAVSHAELIDQATRVQAKTLQDVDRVLDPLLAVGAVSVVEVSAPTGRRAGELRSRYYDRRTRPLSLADCVLVAAASTARSAVATSDRSLAAVAVAEGLHVVALLDSAGVRPALD